ncbi:MAG: dCTP deaminase [Planctomycetota bacterium]|jgi:dCTP deaminase
MAVLCDTQIRELVGIEPCEDHGKRAGSVSYGLSSYGYDVRVVTLFKIFTNVAPHGGQAIVDPKHVDDDMFVTIDTRDAGKDHVIIPPLESQGRGKVTLEISNTTPLPAKIYANEGIAQIVFIKADRVCSVSYAGKGGKYQDQNGLTLPRVD